MAKKEVEETQVPEVKVEETKLPLIEYAIMKKIMHNYFGAFSAYCMKKDERLVPKTLEKWDELFNEFLGIKSK
jgi:hypothetical protein